MFTSEIRQRALQAALGSVTAQLQAGLDKPCFQLRMGTADDIAACKNIHEAIKAEDFVNLGSSTPYQNDLDNDDNGALIVAVGADGEVIGACCFSFNKLWNINLIISSPAKRQEGPIGTALMCAALGTLQNLNVNFVTLSAQLELYNAKNDVRRFNEKLFNWYESRFQFQISDAVVSTILAEPGKNIKDLAGIISVVEMSNDNLPSLKLSTILERAITDKITLNRSSQASSRTSQTTTSPTSRAEPLLLSPKNTARDSLSSKIPPGWREKLTKLVGFKKKS